MSRQNSPDADRLDPITFSVLRSAFRSLCFEAGTLFESRSFTPIIAEAHDASTALLTRDARLVTHGYRDMMPHVGTFEAKVRMVLEDIDEFQPGDIFIVNDPYRGGTHHNDVAFVRPIFVDGEIFAFGLQLGHWLDLGGPVPGTFNTEARDMYAEGLIVPPMKIFERDRRVKPVFKLLEMALRVFDETIGDIHAQAEATRHIERRVQELCARYGADTVARGFEEHMNTAERTFREEIATLPDGVYIFEDFGDADPLDPQGPPIKVRCEMTKAGDGVTFDWTGSNPAPKGSWGFSRPGLLSATYAATMFHFHKIAPLNNGVIRCLNVVSKPGSCVDVLPPTPITGYCSGAYEKVEAAAMACWALCLHKIDPKRATGGHVNLANLVLGGVHPDDNRTTVTYYGLEGGHGALPWKDGNNFLKYLYAGTSKRQEVEIIERWNPVIFTNCEGVKDSCGDGKFRGGFGLERSFKTWAEMVTSIHGDRERFGPYGIGGGTNGGPARYVLNPGTPKERHLGMFSAGVRLAPGDHVLHSSNGGGGAGEPLDRDPQRVLEDVIDDYISLDKARDVYGVVIRAVDPEVLQYEVDVAATEALRRTLRQRPRREGLAPFEVHPLGKQIRVP